MDTEKTILVDANPFEVRVALLENARLAEYYVELPGKERLAGNIYKGVVRNVLPGMEAAFVDIGVERNAFLYCGESQVNSGDFEFNDEKISVNAAQTRITEGQHILVQAVKDPTGTKGARISTNVTLPARLLVLMPEMEYVGVSRRIVDEAERLRLKGMAEALRPKGMGIIVRTAAENCTAEELEADIQPLVARWQDIQARAKTAKPPTKLYTDQNLILRTLRDLMDDHVTKIVFSNETAAREAQAMLKEICPHNMPVIECRDDDYDIFDHYGVESEVKKSFQRKIWLKSGGYLVIDHTEALTVIDVNSGKFVGDSNLQNTILQVNIEAAREIARQIRLRDIGGIVIIDFIDMIAPENREEVIDALKKELKKDRTRTNVQGMTQLGLVEMTRKKIRQRVSAMVHMPCSFCGGTGRLQTAQYVAIDAYRQYRRMHDHTTCRGFVLRVNTEVAQYMEQSGMIKMMPDVELCASRSAHPESAKLTPKEDS
ncbi:MAG: Rne/Rng family ribonuclease [Eubacteriales bacterium]|nr:Rne/Rng family ribonuclease [Eubacteriales bacterium]